MANGETLTPAQQIQTVAQGHLAAGALKAGIELEIFTYVAHGENTAEQLAAAKHTPVRSMRILCDALVALGLLGKSAGIYSLPEASARLLVKGSPTYMGNQFGINFAPHFWDGAQHLTDIVRAGHGPSQGTAEAAELEFWEEFERGSRQMAGEAGTVLAGLVAEVVGEAGPRRVLDIACGSGLYGFAMLKRFPDARLVSMDWANVLRRIEPTAEQMGLRERTEFRPGDLFRDDLGGGYDLVLAVNIFQIYGPEKVTELARRLHRAMAPGGLLVILGPIPDEARERSRFPLMFGLNMLIFTQEGDAYTFGEYQRMLGAAGFHDMELREVKGPRPLSAVVARS